MHRMVRALAMSTVALTLALPVAAQEEGVATTTISAIERGEREAMVYLEGAALAMVDDDEYVFSDGTGVITVDVDEAEGGSELPLFELLGIEGTLDGGEIDVSRWSVLPILTPAVIVEEPEVIEAFWSWIIAYGSQAPTSE